MPKPPKPDTPTASTPEPDLSPFEDWLIDSPAGKWPEPWEADKELSDAQKRIVAANAKLLRNREAWGKKVAAFEAAIAALADETLQKETRAKHLIRFDRHQFDDGPKDFSDYPFPCAVSFSGASFGEGNVRFDRARFGEGDVWFHGARFGEGNVSFDGASFGEGNVGFAGASFGEGDVRFDGASFGEGDVRFNDIDFRATTMPASSMVVAGNLFVKSHFPMPVNFSRLDVKGTASFSGSSFAETPDFRDAKFDRPPEVAGMEVPRPRLGHEGDRSKMSCLSRALFSNALGPDDVAKYRKLKAMALAANDHEKDGEFFAGEMLAKRGTETTGFFGLLFNTAYWWLSDFGQSFVRPLVWLIVSFLGFAVACHSVVRAALSRADGLWFAADFSFRNMLPFFGSLFRFAPAPLDHVSWYQETYNQLAKTGVDIDLLIGLGIAQSLIGTVLLFLFLLALRNKFRLK